MVSTQAVVIAIFILVHLFAGKLRFLEGTPRSIWLSFAGGISVAYVFVHALPELGEFQETLSEHWRGLAYLEHHAYLVALAGLVLFYGLERMVRTSRRQHSRTRDNQQSPTAASTGAFWLHIASFAVYNGLVGYLLVHREDQDARGLLFYSFAMALHFLVNDFGLRNHHKESYRRAGRWVLAGAVILGWLLGLATEITEALIGVLFAFLAGGVILNVLKEELPEERESRFWPFAGGAVLYAAFLLML